LEHALALLEAADRLAPNTYKYVYGLGALNTALQRWDDACRWMDQARVQASTSEERAQVRTELDYCEAKLAQARARTWGAPGVEISFIMKEGTVEMERRTLERLPRRLPAVPPGNSLPLHDALGQVLGGLGARLVDKDGFLVVALHDNVDPELHYQKGIKDFHRYFRNHYFTVAPTRPVVVVISSTPEPLVQATARLYSDVAIPVYAPFLGYYNPGDNLIMATAGSTGYGTLLHEMIHALIHADFPAAPDWLNEGLASLYERTQWRSGRLKALPNWRLERMREESVPSLSRLGQMVGRIGLHSSEIGDIRLFLLFLDEGEHLDRLYDMAKRDASAFSLDQAIRELRLQEDDWRSFVRNTFRDYQAEMALGSGQPLHPDEVRFLQQALNRLLGADLKIDGAWGPSCRAKLVEFQRRFQLKPDGILGKQTMAELQRQYNLLRVKALEGSL
jgi:hypothetical protein